MLSALAHALVDSLHAVTGLKRERRKRAHQAQLNAWTEAAWKELRAGILCEMSVGEVHLVAMPPTPLDPPPEQPAERLCVDYTRRG